MNSKITTSNGLDRVASMGLSTLYPDRLKVLVGSAACGLSMGARKIEEAAIQSLAKYANGVTVTRTGCIGFCSREPLLDLVLPHGPRISYGNMTPKKTKELLSSYFEKGDIMPHLALGRIQAEDHAATGEAHEYAPSNKASEIPEWQTLDFFRCQKKVILRNCGSIDPLSIETYHVNHKDVTLWETDIRNLSPVKIKSTLGLKKGDS